MLKSEIFHYYLSVFFIFLTLHIFKGESNIHNNIHFIVPPCHSNHLKSHLWYARNVSIALCVLLSKHATHTHIEGTRSRAPDLPQDRAVRILGWLGWAGAKSGTVVTAENAAKRMKPNRQLPMAYKLNLLMYYRYLPTTTTTNTASDDDACCFFRFWAKTSSRAKTQRAQKNANKQNG